MAENDRAPRLRAKGFTEDWKPYKLEELTNVVDRVDANSEAPVMMISASDGFIEQSDRYSFNNAGESLKKYVVLKKGELAYNHGASKLRSYGSCFSLLCEEARVPFVYHCFSIKDGDPVFYSLNLNGYQVQKQLKTVVSSGVRMDGLLNISYADYMKTEIFIPSIKEQKRISNLIDQLDSLIGFHQRKYEKLVETKKSLFENMFPTDGEATPRIRFREYTDDWKQHKLGECFSERQERSAEGELISVTINEGIKKFSELGKYDNSSEDKSHYKKVEPGDIAYNSMRMWQGASGVSRYSGILSPAYTVLVPDDGVDSLFFSFVFKRPDVIHTFKISSQGITSDNWNLKYPALSEIECSMPSFDEQGRIAEFLNKLDNLIALQKQKVERLKDMKSALLEKMFV